MADPNMLRSSNGLSRSPQTSNHSPDHLNDPNNNNNKDSDKKKEKQMKKYSKFDPKEEFPDVFKDVEARYLKFEHVPDYKIRKIKKNPKIFDDSWGPYDVQFPDDQYSSFICGRSISTYPHIPGKDKRDGDPICDSFQVQLLEDNVVLAVICDGCNWGDRPKDASNKAKEGMLNYMRSHIHEMSDARDVGHVLLRALSYCHSKICEGFTDVWDAGTTTLYGGMLFRLKELDAEHNEQWAWVSVSIGDCKCFHYSATQGTLTEITEGNRQNVHDARDCGGRLGPYVGDGEPDLRNVFVYYTMCSENDTILLLSDGVHDNLDPQTLGMTPRQLDSSLDYTEWKDIPPELEPLASSLKTRHMQNFLIRDLILGGEDQVKMRNKVLAFMKTDDDSMSPLNITSRIMKHCLAVTASGRQWMVNFTEISYLSLENLKEIFPEFF
eukprot:TRINITY_DN2189_c0_g1_i2.p1 TRINITY_DN2189_c0_g1~~TRINITY_DN2189_c0_g1_i2.p1  ORF type:complete len:438 (+),score=84.53 TRINITY_DN2189_c0_g1_i2:343-1656(+)